MGLKIGITGAGEFGRHFMQLFSAHPDVDEVVLADLIPERAAAKAEKYNIKRIVGSHEELCKSDVDAICIFTQRWKHAPQIIQALRAGKHVWSAVPIGITLEEVEEVVKTVEETGLMFMLAETSYYRPQTIWCRERFAKGFFGEFVYGEGQYHHDMSHGFYEVFQRDGAEWKSHASFPPMLYPTHSISHILSVTFQRMTKVSCLGWVDHNDDGIFRKDVSLWQNDHANQSALFRTSDGGMARINEFRRSAAGESRMSIMGTLGAYEEQTASGVWTRLENKYHEDVSWIRETKGVEINEDNMGNLPREFLGKKHLDAAKPHPVWRLPKEFVGLPNKHEGAHQFLVQDFIEALQTMKLPPNHVWMGARYNNPGIVALESARREGEMLPIPDFGLPPKGSSFLDPTYKMQP